jgi:hypothetical protein
MQGYAKPLTIAVITAILLVFSLGPGLLAGEVAAAPPKVLGVHEFMKNVERYRGKVSLEGVVSAIAPKQRAISLIDRGELQACGVTTCASLTLPVQWRGPMPAVRDLVRVEGQAQEVKGKLMFVADKLEKITRP